ncbi:uncharacterized protein LOC121650743 [Melanotaenia boesemani]|uniref:uncharacterized protein LOC121650743 n=1 Tax=Melanotaenia boesemani TaxID=1250792 RepID=UPI001C04C383|nr:uncharacterized protein LOC121650743 [Melanotaenia boesemani]
MTYWTKKHGFPENGSLSKKELDKLNEAAQKDWDEKKKKKKIKATDVEKWERHNKCIEMWKNESECRVRKANTKEMGGGLDMTGDIGNRRDNASLSSAPPPYNNNLGHSQPSPYRSLQERLQALKVDPDLDSCPPVLQQPQQPQQRHPEDRRRAETSGPTDSNHGQATGGTERPSADMTSPSRTKSGKIYGPEVSATSPFYKFGQTAKGLFLGQNTAEDEDTEVFSAPMVEVSGPTGPILVYRPWSPSEIMEHAKNLPDMDENKKKAESKKEKQMSTALTLFTSQNQPQSNRDRRGRGRGRGRRERGGNQQQRGACYRCDQYGHWKDNCPQRHGPCHRCGQYGHWKDNCPQDNGPTHQKEYQQAD